MSGFRPSTWSKPRQAALAVAVIVVGGGALGGGVLAVRYLVPLSNYVVSSDSMEPTLRRGDVVLVAGSRLACGGARVVPGDLVLMRPPGRGERWVRRIVAGAGRTVGMSRGRLLIDGREVDASAPGGGWRETLPNGRSYRVGHTPGATPELEDAPPVRLPAATVYVLGDNRDEALDSRQWGALPVDRLCAKVTSVWRGGDPRRATGFP